MKAFTLSCLLSFSIVYLSAQQHFGQVLRCGTDHYHEQLMQDPDFAADWHERQHQFRQAVLDGTQVSKMDCDETFFIPVAVHFQNTTIDPACAEQMALDQIRILNEDFSATNGDIDSWNNLKPTIWPNINNGSTCIQFCLATLNHPPGFGLQNGQYAITINQTTADNNPAWAGYINFWVRNLGGGLLGFSPLGGTGNGDGVTCTITAFGSVSCGGNTIMGAYNLGRTITHEIGHYFNLYHPFQGNNCNDAANDQVDDTPRTNTATYGCPINANPNFVNCTDPVLWPSFMDYVDDACMFMFSEGQAMRMQAWFDNSTLKNLANNAATKCEDALCAGFRYNKTKKDESCGGNDGEIQIQATGGNAPYLYSISNGFTFQNNPVFLELDAGMYYLLVQDAEGCERQDSIKVNRTMTTLRVTSLESAFCGDNTGSVSVEVEYDDDFEFNISGSAGWRVSPVFDNLNPGTYTITARNATNCTATISVVIPDESDLNLFVGNVKSVNCPLFDNGEIQADLSNGVPPFNFLLNGEFPQDNGTYKNLSAGDYTLSVLDQRGCKQKFDFTLGVSYLNIDPDCPCQLFIPNAFTPDADGLNDLFKVVPSCPISDYRMRIFDRWGSQIFESDSSTEGWNGGSSGYYAMPGIYFYRITYRWGEARNESLEVEVESGHVQLIR